MFKEYINDKFNDYFFKDVVLKMELEHRFNIISKDKLKLFLKEYDLETSKDTFFSSLIRSIESCLESFVSSLIKDYEIETLQSLKKSKYSFLNKTLDVFHEDLIEIMKQKFSNGHLISEMIEDQIEIFKQELINKKIIDEEGELIEKK